MRAFIITLILLSGSFWAQAQISLERQVIASAGSFSSSGNISLSATIGETMTETVTGGSFTLSQGFQQADLQATAIDDLSDLVVQYKIFPNPTPDLLTIELEKDSPAKIILSLSEINGKAIPEMSHTFSGTGLEQASFSLQNLAEGMYFLSFRNGSGKILLTHKVNKY